MARHVRLISANIKTADENFFFFFTTIFPAEYRFLVFIFCVEQLEKPFTTRATSSPLLSARHFDEEAIFEREMEKDKRLLVAHYAIDHCALFRSNESWQNFPKQLPYVLFHEKKRPNNEDSEASAFHKNSKECNHSNWQQNGMLKVYEKR